MTATASERTSVTAVTTKASAPQRYGGEGQWALIFREFRKRRLAVFAAVIILCLVVISILAPVLANDRPIYYVGVNRFEYREAVRTLRSSIDRYTAARTGEAELRDRNAKVTEATHAVLDTVGDQQAAGSKPNLVTLLRRTREVSFRSNLTRSAEQLTRCRDELTAGFSGPDVNRVADCLNELIAVRKQLGATLTIIEDFPRIVDLQIQLMADVLPATEATRVLELGRTILGCRSLTDIAALTSELRSRQADLRQLATMDSALIARTRWPVLASLRWYDTAFLSGISLIAISPVWSGVWSRWRKPGQSNLVMRLILLSPWLLPVIVAAIWWLIVPERVDRTDYKSGVLAALDAEQKAAVVYHTVMWPPIAYAVDEYDLAGKLSPPAFYRTSKVVDSKASSDEITTRPKAASPWNTPHWLGTDESGRDVLCRMIWGGRVSLSVGMVAVLIYVCIGIVVGAVAGYFRGLCDLVISRIIEVVICFPSFFLILTIAAMIGPGLLNIMLVIGFTGWTGIARLVRGEFLRLVDQEFVLAGRALGYSPMRLIFRHVLPNAMAPVLVSATFGIAGAILTESSLSFLGMGISKPTPSWGSLLADGRETLDRASWLIHFPGFAIFLTITSYNLIGEALRDAADPRLRGSR